MEALVKLESVCHGLRSNDTNAVSIQARNDVDRKVKEGKVSEPDPIRSKTNE